MIQSPIKSIFARIRKPPSLHKRKLTGGVIFHPEGQCGAVGELHRAVPIQDSPVDVILCPDPLYLCHGVQLVRRDALFGGPRPDVGVALRLVHLTKEHTVMWA